MMKRICSVILAATLALSLTACGGTKRESAQAVVEGAINAVQNADFAAMKTYWGEDTLGKVESSAPAETDSEDAQVMKALTQHLTYTVKESKEDEKAGTATVTVEFTNTDMAVIMGEFIQQVFSDALSSAMLPEDQQPAEDEMNQKYLDLLTELMAREDNKTATNTVDINLKLTDGQWKIEPADEAVDAMLGGMLSYAESMSDAFGGAS